MNSKYNSVFDSILAYVKGSPVAGWLFLMALTVLIIGVNDFAEDTYSSYVGFQMLEKSFNVRPASWQLTYWLMSLSFQVLTVISFFAYLSDRERNWWGAWAALGFQTADAFADVWYRSNGIFTDPASVVISLFLTILFFTVGSEFAVTFGVGLTSKLAVEGLTQLSVTVRNFIVGVVQFARVLVSGKPSEKGATDSSITQTIKEVKFSPPGNGNSNKQPEVSIQHVNIQSKPHNNDSRGGQPYRPPFQPTKPFEKK